MYSKSHGFLRGYFVYFRSIENLLSTILIKLSTGYLLTYYYNAHFLDNLYAKFKHKQNDSFFSLQEKIDSETIIKFYTHLLTMFAFFKLMNVLNLNPITNRIEKMLKTGLVDLLIMISFLLLNYALFGILAYFTFNNSWQFSNLKSSIYASVISIVRHIDFGPLIQCNLIWLFFWQAFMFFYMQQILINFVISIIIGHFDEASSGSENRTEIELTFQRIFTKSFKFLRPPK